MKNTKLVYTDEKNLKIYQSLSPEDFKEFFMTYFTYKPGQDPQITDFTNPLLYTVFLEYKDKIDYNEEKWERQAAAKRENGKKGGRPKKSTLQEIASTEFDITPVTNNIPNNEEIENKPVLSPQIIQDDNQYQEEVESGSNGLKMGNNEIKQTIPLRIVANKHSSDVEKLQDLINNDVDFCSIYTKCINYIADYKLNPGDFIKSNSKNMAFSKLERILGESGIPFNDDIKDFINDDVDAKMNSLARLEKIA